MKHETITYSCDACGADVKVNILTIALSAKSTIGFINRKGYDISSDSIQGVKHFCNVDCMSDWIGDMKMHNKMHTIKG